MSQPTNWRPKLVCDVHHGKAAGGRIDDEITRLR